MDPSEFGIQEDDLCWWDLSEAEKVIKWAGRCGDEILVGFVKEVLATFREKEIQTIKSTKTKQARDRILHPDRAIVSRQLPVPKPTGWWSTYKEEDILAVDCEMIPIVQGTKSNGKKICKNVAATLSVVDFHGKIIYKKKVKHEPKTINVTPWIRKKLGFRADGFIDGTELDIIRDELQKLFRGKLLILVNAGSDFDALKMNRGDFDVFDLHSCYWNEEGEIGLRSIVMHYYNTDIQEMHDSDTDAIYTMKVFGEQYITEKSKDLQSAGSRFSGNILSHIKRYKE